jgi:hypothetical protein
MKLYITTIDFEWCGNANNILPGKTPDEWYERKVEVELIT